MTTIIGIKLTNRVENAVDVQKVLTDNGCAIKTRIGLHDEIEGACSPVGIILIEVPKNSEAVEIANALLDIDGVEIQQMKF